MLYGRLVHVGETFNRFAEFGGCELRLATGLRPDPLGSYSAPQDPLAIIRGRAEGKKRVGNGEEMKCEGKGRGGEGRREEGRGGSRLQKYFGLKPHLAVWEQTWVAKGTTY